MNYNIENVSELFGTLTVLKNNQKIQNVYLKMLPSTSKKLARILSSSSVRGEDQDFYFTSISLKREQVELFLEGQGPFEKDGNVFRMTSKPRNPLRFSGSFQALVRASDGYDYACEIKIGSIEFNLFDKTYETNEDIVEFENVSAVVYPHGKYQVSIITE